jgi:glycosyltransferase involved in cell wall biosynthesis
MNDLFAKNGINQIYSSQCYESIKNFFIEKYKLDEYLNDISPVLFIIDTNDDYGKIKIKEHRGNKFLFVHKFKNFDLECLSNFNIIFITTEIKTKILNMFSSFDKSRNFNIYKSNLLKKMKIIDDFDFFSTKKISNNNILQNYEKKILVILLTYNRSSMCLNTINDIMNQTYKNYDLLIIDDGSDKEHTDIITEYVEKINKKNVIFKKNDQNKKIPQTLNIGLKYFLENKYDYFTWISDDNEYYEIFLENLIDNENNFDFSYSHFTGNTNKKIITHNIKYNDVNDLIQKWAGCASFMWSKDAIKKIGYYDENLYGCEDYDYIIRTFLLIKNIYHSYISGMEYSFHGENLFIKENTRITSMKVNIQKIYKTLIDNKKYFVYYSQNAWSLLFQRPHQLIRFFDNEYLKIFITNENIIEYDEKYNVLVVPRNYRNIIINYLKYKNNDENIIYYTDPRLYDEIETIKKNIKIKILFDLIDPPIDEFAIWKPNLHNSVLNADYVSYSHPDLIIFLNDISTEREFYYISNGCDYEHFSKAKERIDSRPYDFPMTSKKILGYYGAFAEWLDYDLIKQYADDGKYHIVMIGGIKNGYNNQFKHDNITWLEHKKYENLPYYLSWFDVCFLPFKDCELTKYVNPCKLWEYMASEKEIIMSNVNINNSEIIKYEELCLQVKNIFFSNKKIAIITNMYLDWETNKPSIGGGERYCMEIIKILKKFNCSIDIHQFGKKNDLIVYDDINVYLYKNDFVCLDEFCVGFSEYINEIIKDKYNLVFYMMPELCCSKNIVQNSILINHGIWFDRKKKSEEYYDLLYLQIQKNDLIICVDTNYINFARAYWGYNCGLGKFNYIPNFVDDDFFIDEKDKEYNDKLTILFPRRANIYRGSRMMEDVCKYVKHNVNFIWCGYGEDYNNLKKLEAFDNRFIATTANFEEIKEQYKKSNIVVIPTVASEGTSLSCIEGMASNNIVLGTNVGGIPNLLIDGYNGFLCNNDSKSLCEKLNYIIENYYNLAHIKQNAQIIAKEAFSKKKWNEKVSSLIKKKLNSNDDYLNSKKIAIVTKNCINGGVESIINIHQKYLNCDIFIANGKIDEMNPPFIFKDNLKTFTDAYNVLCEYDLIISHWVPNYIQDVYDSIKQKTTILEFVHRIDTCDNRKNMLDGIITHSYFLKDFIEKKYEEKLKIDVLFHPIDTKKFKPLNIKKSKIGIIGSYNIFKGIDIFINAMNIIWDNPVVKNYEICIYGKDDGEKNNYIYLAKKMNLNIHFYDNISNVHEICNEFEILCIPSILEGFPMILCEALSCNVKIITSDIAGFLEFDEFAKKNKYYNLFKIFESENYVELSEKIICLLENNDLNNNRGCEFIKKYYSSEKHVENLKNIVVSYLKNSETTKTKKNLKKHEILNFIPQLMIKNDYLSFIYVDGICGSICDIQINDEKSQKFNKKRFLRFLNNNDSNYFGEIIIETINSNNQTLALQIDMIDENNNIVYDINEYVISDNTIIINYCVQKNHKLICINIVPYSDDYIEIKNANLKVFKEISF